MAKGKRQPIPRAEKPIERANSPFQSERGDLRAALAVIIFSMASFVVTFAIVWISLVGFQNPFQDAAEEQTVQDLARADSLKAVESYLVQEISAQRNQLNRLQSVADSLQAEIDQRDRTVKKLEAEIKRLREQVAGVGDERMKQLAKIVAGLSEENLKKITENMDIQLLVSIVLNLSPRKAQTVLNAMEPRRAALVAKEMARIRNVKTRGG